MTHQHADHVDVQRLPALLDANPEARLLVEPQTAGQLVAEDLAAQHLITEMRRTSARSS